MQEQDTSERTAQQALVRALARTADARRDHGRHADAERLYERAISLAEDVFGPQHQELLSILAGLAALRDAQGRPDEARALQGRIAAIRARLLTTDPAGLAT